MIVEPLSTGQRAAEGDGRIHRDLFRWLMLLLRSIRNGEDGHGAIMSRVSLGF